MGEGPFHHTTAPEKEKSQTDEDNVDAELETLQGAITETLEIHDQVNDCNEELTPEEFQHLDKQLDDLFIALDDIESKNDNIHAQLLQLLHSNREIRQQLQQYQNLEVDNSDKQITEGQN
ncbi:bublin coiled-coil protein-like [Cylas formicarius]|uniref:bublin coiled-coil protein-like n=1 Tax=Cylas formicarius TaxID=197179 RepID=UPI002958A85F|nr:bublin coiled-coil protein-like [Cylas formicarius]